MGDVWVSALRVSMPSGWSDGFKMEVGELVEIPRDTWQTTKV